MHSTMDHQCADDATLLLSAETEPQKSGSPLFTCGWFCFNDLAINLDKAEAILYATHKHVQYFYLQSSVDYAGTKIPLSDKN